MACKVLSVQGMTDEGKLKKAYRRTAMGFHPDKNLDDSNTSKKLALVKYAYELLAKDKPCPQLLKEINSWPGVPKDDKNKLDNSWEGIFLG